MQTRLRCWHAPNFDIKMTLPRIKKRTAQKVPPENGFMPRVSKTVKATNSTTFVDFLKDLQKIYSKFVHILDNAKYHMSNTMNKFIDSTKGDIRPVFIPPYMPSSIR